MNIKNKPLLYKFLLSYVLILIFPIVIMLAFYYPYTMTVVKDKSSAWNDHTTEQLMNSMDIFTKYVYNLPAEILQNREIKPYMVSEDPYQKIVIMNEMRKYNITDAFIENTLLYLKDVNYFFSKRGSAYTLNDFNIKGVGYFYSNWPVDNMKQDLQALTSPIIRPVESVIVPGGHNVNILSFILPLPLGGENSPGALFILVKESTILDMMRTSNDESNGIFIITNEDKSCLVATLGCEQINTQAEFSHVLQGDFSTGANRETTIENETYLVSESISHTNGWHYIRLLPISETVGDIRSLQYSTLLLLVIVIVTTSIVIYFSMRSNYHPIKRLVDVAAKLFDEPDSKNKLNEIDTIDYALNQLSTTKANLDEQLKQTKPIIRDQLLFDLLLGNYESWEQFEQDANDYHICFPHRHLTVAAMLIEWDASSDSILTLCRLVFDKQQEHMSCYVMKSYYKREIIILLCHEEHENTVALLTALQQQIQEQLTERCMIGISKQQELADIKSCYIAHLQASRCLDQIRFQHTITLASYADGLQTSNGLISYQSELVQSLELATLKNDIDNISAIIERIQGYMSSEGIPAHVIRTLYLNTMSILFHALEKFQQDNDSILSNIEFVFQQRYTLDQMMSIMNDTAGKLCELLSEAVPSSARRTPSEQIIAIIDQYWADSGLSLQFMADQFQMSASNFSYHFKKTMGQNFKEYIDGLRIQQSMLLLRHNQDSVENIAQQVGYMNSSSFIRSFKKLVGMTPGQYRDQSKQQ